MMHIFLRHCVYSTCSTSNCS